MPGSGPGCSRLSQPAELVGHTSHTPCRGPGRILDVLPPTSRRFEEVYMVLPLLDTDLGSGRGVALPAAAGPDPPPRLTEDGGAIGSLMLEHSMSGSSLRPHGAHLQGGCWIPCLGRRTWNNNNNNEICLLKEYLNMCRKQYRIEAASISPARQLAPNPPARNTGRCNISVQLKASNWKSHQNAYNVISDCFSVFQFLQCEDCTAPASTAKGVGCAQTVPFLLGLKI